MIGKIRLLLAETGQNIWRNVALTIASVIVVGASLALFGSSQLVARGVDNATQRWVLTRWAFCNGGWISVTPQSLSHQEPHRHDRQTCHLTHLCRSR